MTTANEGPATEEVMIRVRIGMEQAHYAGDLVDGAHMLELFGDVATELLDPARRGRGSVSGLRRGGVFGAGARRGLHRGGGTDRARGAHEPAHALRGAQGHHAGAGWDQPSRAEVLEEPVVVCRASGTCVVPLEFQRGAA